MGNTESSYMNKMFSSYLGVAIFINLFYYEVLLLAHWPTSSRKEDFAFNVLKKYLLYRVLYLIIVIYNIYNIHIHLYIYLIIHLENVGNWGMLYAP